MKIVGFQLREETDFNWKTLDFNHDTCILFSEMNSTGKTTLMRAILYTLGFAIPNTELVKFEDYEFKMEVLRDEKAYKLYRKCNLLKIDDVEFDLPIEQSAAHTYLFGIGNAEILSNLLGTIYFDQEKGWTLLNRGTIIGTNRFTIESFFRGIKEDESSESYELVAKISALDKKIAQYKLMLNVAEYQAAVNENINEKLDYQSFDQELEASLLERKMQLSKVDSELARLDEVIKTNKNFSDYIEKKKLFVRNPIDDSPIPVTKATLLDYQSVSEVNDARRSMLVANRNSIKKQIATLESKQKNQITFLNIPTVDEELTKRLADIKGISAIQVKAVLENAKKQRRELVNALRARTRHNNPWIDQAYQLISEYAQELGIPFDYKIDIFTHNLKEKSGAILHKMVFAYKLAYIKLLSQKIGYNIPIFCDSPSGREVEKKTVDEMLRILQRDFSGHQLIIASIYRYEDVFSEAGIIEMDGTLFDKQIMFNEEKNS